MVVCCFMKIRIPRTKREIEMMTAKREMRKGKKAAIHRPSVFNDAERGRHHTHLPHLHFTFNPKRKGNSGPNPVLFVESPA